MENVVITIHREVDDEIISTFPGERVSYVVTLKHDDSPEIVFHEVTLASSAIGLAIRAIRDFESNNINPTVQDPDNVIGIYMNSTKGMKRKFGINMEEGLKVSPGKITDIMSFEATRLPSILDYIKDHEKEPSEVPTHEEYEEYDFGVLLNSSDEIKVSTLDRI